MATKVTKKFPVQYSCGDTLTIDLRKTFPKKNVTTLNQGLADWMTKKNHEDGRLCPDCKKAENRADETQWLLDIEQFEIKYQLPEFTGNEKQLASEGLVIAAMKNRHSVLLELFESPHDEARAHHATLLEAAREVTYIGFWRNELDYKERTARKYGQPEYMELLLDAQQVQRQRAQEHHDTEYIETENPFQ